MTLLVAFDTVFDQCSIAIFKDEHCLYSDTIAGGRGQTERILPMLDTALNSTKISPQQVAVWAFNQGPGAFSGIRINTAAVQALAVATDGYCVSVSSLQVLAQLAYDKLKSTLCEGDVLVSAIDAKQNEVYACFYAIEQGRLVAKGDELLLPYEYTITANVVVGDGSKLICNTLKNAITPTIRPTAIDIGMIAVRQYAQKGGVSPKQALPVYLRHHAWKTLAEQQAVNK